MTDHADLAPLHSLRARITELEQRARALLDPTMRHDITNALGAARNAIILIDEGEEEPTASRFAEIARRNVERAEATLQTSAPAREADAGSSTGASAGDQRNDLGGTREGDNRDAFGL